MLIMGTRAERAIAAKLSESVQFVPGVSFAPEVCSSALLWRLGFGWFEHYPDHFFVGGVVIVGAGWAFKKP